MKTITKNKFLYVFFFIVILGLHVSCKSKQMHFNSKSMHSENKTVDANLGFYFIAQGNKPFWNVKIGEETVVFSSLVPGFETISFTPQEPIRVKDANITMYRLENLKGLTELKITKVVCMNTVSGENNPYQVSVTFLSSESQQEEKRFMGCGRYLTNYRLNDIWVLDSLNYQKVKYSDFVKQLPYLEINTQNNFFRTYTGCNELEGTIFGEREILRFEIPNGLIVTCSTNSKEDVYLKALQKTTTFLIENNRLLLLNSSGTLLVFKKVD